MEKEDKIKFIKKTIIFIIILSFFILLINTLYIKTVISDKMILRQDELFEKNKNNIEILFMGDSHGNCSVNPEYIENSFNFSTVGENYEQTYYKFRNIINEVPKLSTIVIPIDLHSFYNYRKNPYSDVWYWKKYLSFQELNIQTGKNYLNLLTNAYLPFIGNGIDMKRILFWEEKIISPLYKGHSFLDYKIEKELLQEESEVRVKTQFISKELDQDLINSFLYIIDIAIQNNKKIILIKYPVTESYLHEAEKKGANMDFFSAIKNKIPSYDKLYILDFQKSIEDLNFFADSDHLNKSGAEYFSKILNIELKKIE